MYLQIELSQDNKNKLKSFLKENNIDFKMYDTASEAYCYMEAESRVCECEEDINRTLTEEERTKVINVLAKRLFDSDLASDTAYNLSHEVTKELFPKEVA